MLNEIIKILQGKSLEDLSLIESAIVETNKERRTIFLKSLENGDTVTLKSMLDLGVDFNDDFFWRKLYSMDISKFNKEMSQTIFEKEYNYKKINKIVFPKTMDFNMIVNPFLKDDFFDPIVILRKLIKVKVEKQFQYRGFSQEFFEVGKALLGNEKLISLAEKMFFNLAREEKLNNNYEKVHAFIIINGLIKELFNGISNKENMEYFLSVPEYNNYFTKTILKEDKEKLMFEAVKKAELGKIKLLIDLGVELPKEKQPYSDLFLKTQEQFYEAQSYVIHQMSDITFGGQIALKTILHEGPGGSSSDRRMNLVQQIVERYSDEQIHLIIKITEKRNETDEVKFVKNFYNYKQLNNEIPKKNDVKTNKMKV